MADVEATENSHAPLAAHLAHLGPGFSSEGAAQWWAGCRQCAVLAVAQWGSNCLLDIHDVHWYTIWLWWINIYKYNFQGMDIHLPAIISYFDFHHMSVWTSRPIPAIVGWTTAYSTWFDRTHISQSLQRMQCIMDILNNTCGFRYRPAGKIINSAPAAGQRLPAVPEEPHGAV